MVFLLITFLKLEIKRLRAFRGYLFLFSLSGNSLFPFFCKGEDH